MLASWPKTVKTCLCNGRVVSFTSRQRSMGWRSSSFTLPRTPQTMAMPPPLARAHRRSWGPSPCGNRQRTFHRVVSSFTRSSPRLLRCPRRPVLLPGLGWPLRPPSRLTNRIRRGGKATNQRLRQSLWTPKSLHHHLPAQK